MVLKRGISTYEGLTPVDNLTAEQVDHYASLGRRIFMSWTADEPNIVVMDGGRRGFYVHTGRFSFHWGRDPHEHTKKDHVLGVTYPSWRDPEEAGWSERMLAEFDRDYNPVVRPAPRLLPIPAPAAPFPAATLPAAGTVVALPPAAYPQGVVAEPVVTTGMTPEQQMIMRFIEQQMSERNTAVRNTAERQLALRNTAEPRHSPPNTLDIIFKVLMLVALLGLGGVAVYNLGCKNSPALPPPAPIIIHPPAPQQQQQFSPMDFVRMLDAWDAKKPKDAATQHDVQKPPPPPPSAPAVKKAVPRKAIKATIVEEEDTVVSGTNWWMLLNSVLAGAVVYLFIVIPVWNGLTKSRTAQQRWEDEVNAAMQDDEPEEEFSTTEYTYN